MKLLTTLSPTETILILDPSTDLKDLIKYTFIDLLLKGVLEIQTQKVKANRKDKKTRWHVFVYKGKNFLNYHPKSYELHFKKIHYEYNSDAVLIREFIKTVYDNIPGDYTITYQAIRYKNVKPFFKRSVIQYIFGGVSLNSKGEKTRGEILSYLRSIDELDPDIFFADPEKGLNTLLNLGGNMFLIQNPGLLIEIDRLIQVQNKPAPATSYEQVGKWWDYLNTFEDRYFFGEYDTTSDDYYGDGY